MRYAHTVIQLFAVLGIAWAIAELTHNWAWGGLVLGVAILTWSVMAELARPIRRRNDGPNLREIA